MCPLCKQEKGLTSHHVLNMERAIRLAVFLKKTYPSIRTDTKHVAKLLHSKAGTQKLCRECHNFIESIDIFPVQPKTKKKKVKKVRVKLITEEKKRLMIRKYSSKYIPKPLEPTVSVIKTEYGNVFAVKTESGIEHMNSLKYRNYLKWEKKMKWEKKKRKCA